MPDSETVRIPERTIPVRGEYDVIVAGGGPAGIAAATAAAREGARTLLVEQLAFLGGMASAGLIRTFMDTPGGKVFNDIVRDLTHLGAAHALPNGRIQFDGEAFKAVALKALRRAGADVLLMTCVEGAYLQDGRPAGLVILNKGGPCVVRARVLIDATGDGDVAASAGADYEKGDPGHGRMQHVSFKYRIDGVDPARGETVAQHLDRLRRAAAEARGRGELVAPCDLEIPPADHFPFYADGRLDTGQLSIRNVDGTDPAAVSRTLQECLLAAHQVAQFCRKHVPGFEKCRVSRTQALLGVRETRRIMGRYILTADDVVSARKFEDGIARACFFLDLHDSPFPPAMPLTHDYKKETRPPEGDWYEIPYRCLVPKRIEGLLTAGRCISSDRVANGSLRVMPTCMFTGEAAGTAAALAVRNGVLPHDLEGALVRQALAGRGNAI